MAKCRLFCYSIDAVIEAESPQDRCSSRFTITVKVRFPCVTDAFVSTAHIEYEVTFFFPVFEYITSKAGADVMPHVIIQLRDAMQLELDDFGNHNNHHHDFD